MPPVSAVTVRSARRRVRPVIGLAVARWSRMARWSPLDCGSPEQSRIRAAVPVSVPAVRASRPAVGWAGCGEAGRAVAHRRQNRKVAAKKGPLKPRSRPTLPPAPLVDAQVAPAGAQGGPVREVVVERANRLPGQPRASVEAADIGIGRHAEAGREHRVVARRHQRIGPAQRSSSG